jgi:hypothetical protein
MLHTLDKILLQNGLVTSFALVGLIMWVSSLISRKLTFGRVHGSAIAIVIGLVMAYFGGVFTGGGAKRFGRPPALHGCRPDGRSDVA